MKNGQALHTSPYVTQIEKYADSIKQLSRTFLHLEEKKSAFSNEEIEDMFDRTKERACKMFLVLGRGFCTYLSDGI